LKNITILSGAALRTTMVQFGAAVSVLFFMGFCVFSCSLRRPAGVFSAFSWVIVVDLFSRWIWF
jgi:hypothetical protein